MCTETCFVHINYIKHYEVNKFHLSFQGFGHSAVVLFHPKLRLSTCPCHSISSSVIPRSVILLLNPIHPSIHPSFHPCSYFSSDLPFVFPLLPIQGLSVEIYFPNFFSHVKPLSRFFSFIQRIFLHTFIVPPMMSFRNFSFLDFLAHSIKIFLIISSNRYAFI